MCLLLSRAALAEPSVSAAWALGLDSNPAQQRAAQERWFAHYALDGSRRTQQDGIDLDVLWDGWYRDYEGANDSYRLSAQGRWQRAFQQGRGWLSWSLDGALYRDQLVTADERNEAALGLRYDYLFSALDEISLAFEWRALRYLNASLPWAGRPGGSVNVVSGAPRQRLGSARMTRRDDHLQNCLLEFTHHWTPTFASTWALRLERLDSSVPAETYQQYGTLLGGAIELAQDWRVNLTLEWQGTEYSHAPRQLRRDDERLAIAAALRHSIGVGELFCDVSYLRNVSTLDVKSFRQTVSECGLAWAF
jgi:hypothetical protein